MDQRQKVAILRVLREAEGPLGSGRLAEKIAMYGIDLSARAVRLHLEALCARGLVTPAVRGRGGGRSITPAGVAEINDALVLDRVAMTAGKVDDLAWRLSYDPASGGGEVVLNLSTVHATLLRPALAAMLPVFEAGLGMGRYACVAEPGTRVGAFTVPAGQVAIGTVCSLTANGVLLSRRVPVTSRFGGVLELVDGEPVRFTDVIYYEGTSLDPLEVFIKGQLTCVRDVARTGCGRIGVGFREVPTSALETVVATFDELEQRGLGRILLLGKPNRPVLGFPVPEGRTGLVVAAGLNPLAAVEEEGIHAQNFALSELYDVAGLEPYSDLARRYNLPPGGEVQKRAKPE